MRIQKIAKLCKETKTVFTKKTDGGLWVGNSHCMYLLPEFTHLEQEGVALALGIAGKDKGKYIFQQITLEDFCTEDFDETETVCEPMNFGFNTANGTVQAYKTQEGVLFLRTDRLAIFSPEEIINQNFIERLEEFNALCRMKFQNNCAEQKQDYEQAQLEGIN